MIAVIDLGMGNLRSVAKAIEAQGQDVVLAQEPAQAQAASHLVLPGVGAFAVASARLAARGWDLALRDRVALGTPLLGICLGMQLLADSGVEGGASRGLGLVPGRVPAIPVSAGLPVPHMGWNCVRLLRRHPVLAGVKDLRDFYFVHSYHFRVEDGHDVVATTDYGEHYAAVVARGSVVGCQFHPEKSQRNGLRILDNFCQWDGLWSNPGEPATRSRQC